MDGVLLLNGGPEGYLYETWCMVVHAMNVVFKHFSFPAVNMRLPSVLVLFLDAYLCN